MMTNNRLRMTRIIKVFAMSSVICHLSSAAVAAPSHCLSLYGECKYKPGFTHFDYVNPDAPKGGSVKLAETGTFDNLNPFILKGVKAPGITTIFDSLMVASMDEPQTMYGLIASSVDVADEFGGLLHVIDEFFQAQHLHK